MFQRLKYILITVAVLLFSLLFALFFASDSTWVKDKNIDTKVYKPYVLNTEIDFRKDGNSFDFAEIKNGWGEKENRWRCTVGKKSEIKLYVKDGQNTTMILKVTGFGVHDPAQTPNQKITVFANNTKVAEWIAVWDTDTYTAKIPANLMKDDTLVISFVIDKPFVSAVDPRPLGLAVKKMVITKPFGNKTKIKMAKWIKNQLKDIETPEFKDSDENK